MSLCPEQIRIQSVAGRSDRVMVLDSIFAERQTHNLSGGGYSIWTRHSLENKYTACKERRHGHVRGIVWKGSHHQTVLHYDRGK